MPLVKELDGAGTTGYNKRHEANWRNKREKGALVYTPIWNYNWDESILTLVEIS